MLYTISTVFYLLICSLPCYILSLVYSMYIYVYIVCIQSAAPSAESIKKLDDDDHHAAVVLAATSDLYVLTQDMCMSCGSYGSGAAADLITCTQCGQCYHPFCVQVKVSACFNLM